MMGPSPMLAHGERRWMRPAALWRATTTSDGAGGRTTTWAQQGSVDVAAGIPSPAERATAEQEGVELGFVLKVSADADVRRGDRLVLADDHVVEVDSTVGRTGAGIKILRGHDEPWRPPLT